MVVSASADIFGFYVDVARLSQTKEERAEEPWTMMFMAPARARREADNPALGTGLKQALSRAAGAMFLVIRRRCDPTAGL